MPWDVLVASLASGTFALLGVGLSNLTAVRREQATFATQTALELADMERHIWKQDWIELQIQLERLGARLAVSGVPEDLMQAFHDISVACWRDQTPVLDPDDREQISIARDLLDGRRVVQRAYGHISYRASEETRTACATMRSTQLLRSGARERASMDVMVALGCGEIAVCAQSANPAYPGRTGSPSAAESLQTPRSPATRHPLGTPWRFKSSHPHPALRGRAGLCSPARPPRL
jgi:hypothetical protein